MNPVEEKEKSIRDLVNHPWKLQSLLGDKPKWNKLCASMDVIGDAQIAINSYFSLPSFKAENGGYLFLYGLLQAFFLQQDAINNLSEALFSKKINWKKEYPEIFQIRDIRNSSTGHPTKRGNDDSFHFIARYSVSKGRFRLMSQYPKKEKLEFTDIDLNQLRIDQENSVVEILNNVIETMEKEYNDHKSKFKNKKLTDLVPGSFSYSVGKVYEGVYNHYPLVEMNFSIIKETTQIIKTEIINRYGKIEALSGLSDVIRRIDYIIEKLEKWIENDNLLNNNDAEVFLDSFSDRFKELEEMLFEIDKEFE
ncbi:hypothetical protein [Winogradskyella vincentii]|uniref:Uncharacterized protein n=1 Tax=Winogradskyella vincentii TaxID=2877122 RepID=A0ABS7Y1F3_9FLAO|nr:hypothetical protein [Winogradskyella vincentii]MCA0153758.1 hypothetical protein [Winogradskyella vincentii]